MDTYYRLVNGELVDVSVQLFHHHEQLKKERDFYKKGERDMAECVDNIREAMGLESTHFLVLPDDVADMKKERDQWKLDAVEMARSIYQTGNGTITQRQVIMAKAIIDKAEGKA